MDEIEVTIEFGFHFNSAITEVIITIGQALLVPNPSPELLEACPEQFTCFVCLEKHPNFELGGQLSGEWVCRLCFPYMDDWSVGCLRKFDDRRLMFHGHPRQRSRPGSITDEDMEWWDEEGWLDSYTKEQLKLSPAKLAAIENLRRLHRLWLIAKRKGFPGYHPPEDDKIH